ncbi:MAG: hypothetical protein KKH98_03835, partial [Spirochaetes bacterium]|nr:hypothetical protein [Spirochaetota bacterium]
MKKHLLIRSLLILILTAFTINAEITTHIFPIIPIEKSSKETVDMDYLVHSDTPYSIQIIGSPSLNCYIKTHEIMVIPLKDFTGLTTLSLKITSKKDSAVFDIPVQVLQNIFPVKFGYSTEDPSLKVSVAGSFNGWMANKDILTYDDKNKVYTNTLNLKSGVYQYKFIVNDKWIFDPSNPQKSPDGFGSYNSILQTGEYNKPAISIIPLQKEKFFIHCEKKISFKKKHIKLYINNQSVTDLSLVKNQIILKENKNIENMVILITHPDCQTGRFIYDKKKDDWNRSVLYFVFTDRFFNGNSKNDRKEKPAHVDPYCDYMGGDFQGIKEKIESGYFKELGVDTLWISPVNDNPEEFYRDHFPPHKYFGAYHGYWPGDPVKPENHFGTETELKDLIRTAHKNSIKILFDMVFNHTHTNHPLYRDHPDWYGSMYTPDKRLNLRLFEEFPFTTWFDFWIPSLDYSNKEVPQAMIDNALWWIKEYNIDGFRLDAVKHIPPSFWKQLRSAVRKEIELEENRLFYMVGESISDRETINQFIGYDKLDGQFDFPLYF